MLKYYWRSTVKSSCVKMSHIPLTSGHASNKIQNSCRLSYVESTQSRRHPTSSSGVSGIVGMKSCPRKQREQGWEGTKFKENHIKFNMSAAEYFVKCGTVSQWCTGFYMVADVTNNLHVWSKHDWAWCDRKYVHPRTVHTNINKFVKLVWIAKTYQSVSVSASAN